MCGHSPLLSEFSLGTILSSLLSWLLKMWVMHYNTLSDVNDDNVVVMSVHCMQLLRIYKLPEGSCQ